jgi:hypothetical protein
MFAGSCPPVCSAGVSPAIFVRFVAEMFVCMFIVLPFRGGLPNIPIVSNRLPLVYGSDAG